MTETIAELKVRAKKVKTVVEVEKLYTVDEYFELEKHSNIRHEFYYGKLIAMPGESKNANEISQNCAFAFRTELRQRGFRIFIQDVRTVVKGNKIYRYPDVVVADEEGDSDTHNIKKPRILVEVISETSKYRDRVTKLQEYSKLPSLEYYIVVDQDTVNVEVYSRRENDWAYQLLENLTDVIDLSVLGTSLSLATIYENIKI